MTKKTVKERVEEFTRKNPKKVTCVSTELLELVQDEAGGPITCAWLGFQFGYMRGYNAAKRKQKEVDHL